ncbi:hypothetical protein D3C72_387240 [compost metagenome]
MQTTNQKPLTAWQKTKIVVPAVAMMAGAGTLPAFAQASIDPNIAAATANSGAILDAMDDDAGKLKTLMGTLILIALVVSAIVAGHHLWKRLTAQAG